MVSMPAVIALGQSQETSSTRPPNLEEGGNNKKSHESLLRIY
jgi:hypothetical protein